MSKVRIALTFLVVSAIPLIVSIAAVYISRLVSAAPDSPAVSPWLVVGAVYVTPVWALIVGVALAIYARKSKKQNPEAVGPG